MEPHKPRGSGSVLSDQPAIQPWISLSLWFDLSVSRSEIKVLKSIGVLHGDLDANRLQILLNQICDFGVRLVPCGMEMVKPRSCPFFWK